MLARGRRMLNAFSFSGGFSIYAARGGATAVTDLDISAHALAAAQRNFALNRNFAGVAVCRHDTAQGDAFEWLAASAANPASRTGFRPMKSDRPPTVSSVSSRASA